MVCNVDAINSLKILVNCSLYVRYLYIYIDTSLKLCITMLIYVMGRRPTNTNKVLSLSLQ